MNHLWFLWSWFYTWTLPLWSLRALGLIRANVFSMVGGGPVPGTMGTLKLGRRNASSLQGKEHKVVCIASSQMIKYSMKRSKKINTVNGSTFCVCGSVLITLFVICNMCMRIMHINKTNFHSYGQQRHCIQIELNFPKISTNVMENWYNE